MELKEESEKAGLKLNIQKTKMASGPITSWQIDGETMETVPTELSVAIVPSLREIHSERPYSHLKRGVVGNRTSPA